MNNSAPTARVLGSLLMAVSVSAWPADVAKIAWQDWSASAFTEASDENRMILLDVGMEGCTACRRMDEITFTDPTVIALINRHFVAIAVDAEARPDIGERYSDWAWPAIIFMAPDTTQVLALRGNRVPRNFVPILKELIDKQSDGELSPDRLAPYAAPPKPEETDLTRIRDRVRAQLDRSLNAEFGGWSRNGYATVEGAPLRDLYLRARLYDMESLRALAIKSTDGYITALDPVWGGVFVRAFHPGAQLPERFRVLRVIPEKRISNQAHVLRALASALQITGDDKYRHAITEVDRYVRGWMMAADGTFYTSQEDDPPNLPSSMSTLDYWALNSDSARRAFGIPPIDHATYTDKNGEVIAAYVRVFEATGVLDYLNTAQRAAESLLQSRLHADGWMQQSVRTQRVVDDQRMRPFFAEERPFLSAQVWFGTAMLALYRATGEQRWLAHAQGIASAMRDKLEDPRLGGFFSTVADDTVAIIPVRKPLEHNGTAAHFLYDLWVYTKDDNLEALPARTLRAVADPKIISREGKVTGQFALALEKVTASYVEFTVVGAVEDPRAAALFNAGRLVYEPRKLLHYEKPGRYPDRGRAALYICNPDVCSLPIEDPGKVAAQAQLFRGPL